jgi:hypothetical protein
LEKLSPEERSKLKAEWAEGVWAMAVRDLPQLLAEFGQPTIDILPAGAAESLQGVRSAFEKLKQFDARVMVRDDADGERARALFAELAKPAEKLGAAAHEELYWCDRYATMINFHYWKGRAVAESEADTITARQLFFTGLASFRDGDLETAHTKLQQGLELWKTVLDKHTRLRDDDMTAEETVRIVGAYKAVRSQLEMPPLTPEETPFQKIIDRLTPFQPTAEQQEMMMQQMREMQKPGGGASDAMKKAMMEKMRSGVKPSSDSPPAKSDAPPESPKND